MKIQPASVSSLKELEEHLINHMDAVHGEPRLLEKSFQTDHGAVLLAVDHDNKLVVFLPVLERDDSALVRLLAIRGWLRRHWTLIERLFHKKGAGLSKVIRLVSVAPEFSREMELAVREMSRDIELIQFRAVSVNRQVVLFLEPFDPDPSSAKGAGAPSPEAGEKKSPAPPRGISLTSEEKRFFSASPPSH